MDLEARHAPGDRCRLVEPGIAVAEVAEDEVVADGGLLAEPLFVAILEHDADRGAALAHREPLDRAPLDGDAPRRARLEAGDGAHQLALPVALDSGHADDLPARTLRSSPARRRWPPASVSERPLISSRIGAPSASSGRANGSGASRP